MAILLADISDKLALLNATTVSAAGGKPKKPKPLPRPETARDRVQARRDRENYRNVVSIFAPHAGRTPVPENPAWEDASVARAEHDQGVVDLGISANHCRRCAEHIAWTKSEQRPGGA